VPSAVPPSVAAEPTPAIPVITPAETHRDLTAIAEINRLMYRQPTPREILAATAAAIARHLNVARCLVVVGAGKEGVQITAQFFGAGKQAVPPARIPEVVAAATQNAPDSLGAIELQSSSVPELNELGLESALAVVLADKESQEPAGALLVGDTAARAWKPTESFFLQAVGDQLLLSVNHARLRSLVRSLAVADEKTGLLNRAAYIDCLLAETNRAKAQSTPLSLIVLHVDGASELLREFGDAAVEQYVTQLARTISSAIRQTDVAVKYTAWSLVYILPDTSLENAQTLAEKLRQAAAAVVPPWGPREMAVTAVVAEVTARAGDESEDRVTEWINRAEFGLEDALHRGGNALVALATP
jgi:diguanylate cyclase (GGDEF)-like protein